MEPLVTDTPHHSLKHRLAVQNSKITQKLIRTNTKSLPQLSNNQDTSTTEEELLNVRDI